MKHLMLALAFLAGSALAQWSAPQVGSFAVATLKEPVIEKKLRDRFKAEGSPVFLIGNPGAGLQQGDIVRFANKAVLVDADVWQTLASEGALQALKQAPLVRVKAGVDPSAWIARSKMVPNQKERRLYEFGSALLKVLEASMGRLPDGQKLFLSFEGGQMVLTAPGTFLDRMRAGAGSSESSPSKDKLPKGKPHIASLPPADSLQPQTPIDWTLWAVDDLGGPTYSYQYSLEDKLPSGLTWDPESHRVVGVIKEVGTWSMVFRVSDASGGRDSLIWKLVVANEAPVKKDAAPRASNAAATDPSTIELPWDTLIESRWYEWKLDQQVALWEKSGIRLETVDAELADVVWKNSVLSIRPRREGTATLRMRFSSGAGVRMSSRDIPVKRYPMPVFLSRSGGANLLEGARRVYHPVAQDAFGGKVSITAEYPIDAPVDWDGSDLRIAPRTPGAWSVKLIARDTLDHTTEQWVSFVAEAKMRSRSSLETWWVSGVHPWMATMEFGRGRLTLFSPQPRRILFADNALEQDWPYLLLGSNLLGQEAIARGQAFSIDLGGTLRLPNAAVLTGGIVGRIQARHDARPAYPWVFEGEFMGWVQQAIVATDTARLRSTMTARNDDAGLGELQERYGAVLGRVLSDAFDRHNGVFQTRLEGWLQTPWPVQVGFGVWREDLPVSMTMSQRLSGGLRLSPSGWWGEIEATARLGWGPAKAGTAAWWNLRWSSGILP